MTALLVATYVLGVFGSICGIAYYETRQGRDPGLDANPEYLLSVLWPVMLIMVVAAGTFCLPAEIGKRLGSRARERAQQLRDEENRRRYLEREGMVEVERFLDGEGQR